MEHPANEEIERMGALSMSSPANQPTLEQQNMLFQRQLEEQAKELKALREERQRELDNLDEESLLRNDQGEDMDMERQITPEPQQQPSYEPRMRNRHDTRDRQRGDYRYHGAHGRNRPRPYARGLEAVFTCIDMMKRFNGGLDRGRTRGNHGRGSYRGSRSSHTSMAGDVGSRGAGGWSEGQSSGRGER